MKDQLIDTITRWQPRSAWDRGVRQYALDALEATDTVACIADVLNGARDVREYSEGGCALIYDTDIAERLCTPSELRRKRGAPNSRETWLDVQTRALRQAFARIKRLINLYERIAQ